MKVRPQKLLIVLCKTEIKSIAITIAVTDVQILGCELHQNACGGRAPPGPAMALPQTP